MRIWVSILLLISGFYCQSQLSTFPVNGVQNPMEKCYAFTNAYIIVSPDKHIPSGTMVIRKGKIESIGEQIQIPLDAVVINCKNKWIYPSFIDLYAELGLSKNTTKNRQDPLLVSDKKGAYGWNKAIHPEFHANEVFELKQQDAQSLRKYGIGTVMPHLHDGISRGTSTLVNLVNDQDNLAIIKSASANHFSFSKGSSDQDYPSSLMGSIALLRQSFLDAKWYASDTSKTEYNISLEHFNKNLQTVQIFECNDKWDVLRADRIGDEMGVQFIFKSGNELYQRIDEIKKTNASFIVDLNFPKAIDIKDPLDADMVSTAELKHWDLAPFNALSLSKNNIDFSFTTFGSVNAEAFFKAIQKVKSTGLSDTLILKALTVTPSKMIKMDQVLGTLEKGKFANFIISSEKPFSKSNVIEEVWVNGQKNIITPSVVSESIKGNYTLTYGGKRYKFSIDGMPKKWETTVWVKDSTKEKGSIQIEGRKVSFSFKHQKESLPGYDDSINTTFRFSGLFSEDYKFARGEGVNPLGSVFSWTLQFDSTSKQEIKSDEKIISPVSTVWFPFQDYGNKDILVGQDYLIKNTKVWTNEKDGILSNTDVLISNGIIKKIGKDLKESSALIIDGTNKHLTNGIIDEHSHIAISGGVNEGTQSSSAEVRIGDVVNPDDVNIFRQLAGGVIAAQLLHGSANPIGGQSAIIKFRWGKSDQEMIFKEAPGFIKFALGENVKQSNWGDNNTIRFPQTRMGVEQVYYDYFIKAREYSLKNPNNSFRKDLELEALSEILKKQRFISCHSYVQSEINMLMKVADSLGFKVNTFTHILEGYKVADKMKEHGVSASTFSDWWAYKYEVIDAIPYNATLLSKMGINTCINSDDAEMARRLNQEAAKAVKYGQLSEEEAWKLVTLNPAKALHVDKYTGSIKTGKSADLVLWSDNPLSVYASCEKTWIDGVLYFDRENYQKKLETNNQERNVIIQKMLQAIADGEPSTPLQKKEETRYGCMGQESH